MQNDSLVREFDDFRRSLAVREPITSNIKPGTGEGLATRTSRRAGVPHETTSQGTNIERTGDGNTASGESSNNEFATRENGVVEIASRDKDVYMPRNRESNPSRAAYPYTEKLSVGETISINKADTTEWKKIPGIGSAYASRIVKYRDLLGGFVHVEQLLEVYGIDQDLFARIVPYIESDGDYKRLPINQMEFNDLLRHPYLNYKQVQAIMSVRRRKGNITSIRELSMLKEFTTEEILRLEPYLGF